MRVVKTGLVAAALLMTTIVCAQEKHHKMTAEERAKMKTERMAKQLTLTDAQVDKLNAINLEAVKKSDELRADTTMADEARREAMKAQHKATKEQVEAMLTDEQRKQLAEKHETRRAEAKKHREQWKNATPEERAQMKTERLGKELTLTDDQKKKLTDLNLLMDQKREALRADTALTDEQRKAEMKSLHQTKRAELKKILTEEQLKQLKEDKCRTGEKPEKD